MNLLLKSIITVYKSIQVKNINAILKHLFLIDENQHDLCFSSIKN